MSDELRIALGILHYQLECDFAAKTSQVAAAELQRDAYAASAIGWRFLATGDGDEKQILEAVEKATENLMAHERQRPGRPERHLRVIPNAKDVARYETDERVIRRFVEQEQTGRQSLFALVKAAFDAGEYPYEGKGYTVEVHLQRVTRRMKDEYG